MMTLSKHDMFDLSKIDKTAHTFRTITYFYYRKLNGLLKTAPRSNSTNLFRMFTAATPNYYSVTIPEEEARYLVTAHEDELSRFIDLVIYNRREEIIYGVSAPHLDAKGVELICPPLVSEDTAELLRLFTSSVERKYEGAKIGKIGLGSMLDMITNKLTGIYMNMVREFETPQRSNMGRTPLDMVEVNRQDYKTLLRYIKQEILTATTETDQLLVYRALYVFIHLHYYEVLMTFDEEAMYSIGRATDYLSTINFVTKLLNGRGIDEDMYSSTWGAKWEIEKYNTYLKRYRGYGNLTDIELLAFHPNLECKLPVDPKLERSGPSKATEFIALQTLVYEAIIDLKKRRIEAHTDGGPVCESTC